MVKKIEEYGDEAEERIQKISEKLKNIREGAVLEITLLAFDYDGSGKIESPIDPIECCFLGSDSLGNIFAYTKDHAFEVGMRRIYDCKIKYNSDLISSLLTYIKKETEKYCTKKMYKAVDKCDEKIKELKKAREEPEKIILSTFLKFIDIKETENLTLKDLIRKNKY